PDGSVVSFVWDLAGEAATGPVVEHSFETGGAKTITLVVKDNGGAETETSQNVVVRAPDLPIAKFTLSASTVELGGSVRLDGGESNSPDGDIISYAWSCGGSFASGSSTKTCMFSDLGEVTVALQVTDSHGGQARLDKQILVVSPQSTQSTRGGEANSGESEETPWLPLPLALVALACLRRYAK
ncbi:MAG: PKD domain-containing protein, partial [Thermoplasmatota archaeon]